MSTTDNVLDAVNSHRRETRDDLKELRTATVEMASAVSKLTTTVARVEERNARHDDGMRRVSKTVDDHESRIRTLESKALFGGAAAIGGWKVLTVMGGLAVGMAVIVSAFA